MGDSEDWDYRFPGGATLSFDGEITPIGQAGSARESGVWSKLRYRHPGGPEQPALEMGVEVRDGVPLCSEIRLIASDSGQVRVKDLQMLAGMLEDYIEGLVALEVFERTDGHAGWWSHGTPVDPVVRDQSRRANRRTVQTARRESRRKLTPELLSSAADLYRAAQGNRLKAIQHGLDVSERTAARYVARAREEGLLDG